MNRPRKPKLTRAEKVLKHARENPSPKSKDPKQLDFLDHAKREGFAKLDAAIAKVEREGDQ
jgi:hypothetical protein